MITICNLTTILNHNRIIDSLDLTIPKGKMTVIIGRSGEGKSILLKQIIGLITPTAGTIYIDNIDITIPSPQRIAILQQCGYVFQFAALLDSLTVWQNVGITMIEKGIPNHQILSRVKETLELVHLPQNTLHKYPSELSGGMAKRVSLARTLITQPKIILYDEPTTGLDPLTERRIHELMHSLQEQFSVTSIVISHSTDIFHYADHAAFLHKGKIRYFGSSADIWHCNNPYVHQYINKTEAGPIQTD